MTNEAPIKKIKVAAYKIPTESPESDGTLNWDSTTLILVEIYAGNCFGIGFTYGDCSLVKLIQENLAKVIIGIDAFAISAAWLNMWKAVRNIGRPGMAMMAISAIDFALWDLNARLLKMPLIKILQPVRYSIPIYGSGGFTSYSINHLQKQLKIWVDQGIQQVKMKIGRNPKEDIFRVKAAREVIGDEIKLFVDANGAYSRKQALKFAEEFAEYQVSWFEEPVSSDDLEGLRLLRDHAPSEMDIAAGEYGYDIFYFQKMIASGGVDVLQADGTRCGGITGFLQAASLCFAHNIDLSAHTAPQLHAHVSCAALNMRHVEYFFDHVRIENMFFDGVLVPKDGMLTPNLSSIGHGLEFKTIDATKYLIH